MPKDSAAAADKAVARQGENDWWSWYLDDDCPHRSPDACLAAIKEKVRDAPELLRHRGAVGELLLHWVALLAPEGGGGQGATVLSAKAAKILGWLVETQDVDYLNSVYDFHLSSTSIASGSSTRGLYDGEGLLHICVIKRDKATLQSVFKKRGVHLDRRAHGTFFTPGTQTYFGEYVISFAVTTDWVEGLDIIKEYVDSGKSAHGSTPFSEMLSWEDSWGNTALHLASLNKRRNAYTWLRKHGSHRDPTRRNCLGLTAVSLAAVVNDADMFEHVLRDMYQVKWNFGHVTCFRLPLEQIETVDTSSWYVAPTPNGGAESTCLASSGSSLTTSGKKFRSVIELILMQRCEHVVVNPLIMEILRHKWNRFGRWMFAGSCAVQISYLFTLGLLASEYHSAEGKTESLTFLEILALVFTLVNWTAMALDIISGALALHAKRSLVSAESKDVIRPTTSSNGGSAIGDKEWADMLSGGRSMTGKPLRRDVFPVSVYDYLAWFGQLLITIHTIIYAVEPTGVSDTGTAMLSLGIVLVWQSSMHLCLASKHFGTLVIVIMRVLRKDIPSFFVFLLISCAGFSQGLRLLNVPDADNDFSTFVQGLLTMFRVLLGEKPAWTMNPTIEDMGTLGWIGALYYVLFSASTTIVLLRLMISMFNETYGGVKKHAEAEYRLTWGQMILRAERRLKLLVPTHYHHYMSLDDPAEDSCSYVFHRVDNAKFDTEKDDGMVSGMKPPEASAQPDGEEQTVMGLLAVLKSQELELQRLRGRPEAAEAERGKVEFRPASCPDFCRSPSLQEAAVAGSPALLEPVRKSPSLQAVVDLPGATPSDQSA